VHRYALDTLAGPDRDPADALPVVIRLAEAVLTAQARELPDYAPSQESAGRTPNVEVEHSCGPDS
jgi:hypothetical protein